MKKIIVFILLLLLLGVIFFFLSGNGASQELPKEADTILFYGATCPHCVSVEEYIKANKIEEKFQFSKGEVYLNKKNAEIFRQKARECGIAEDNLGVPMLWSNGKCYLGQEEVIDFLKNKAAQ